MKTNTLNNVVGLGLAIVLSACGGGGGDSAAPSAPPSGNPAPPVTAPSPTPADIQTSVPAMTYAQDSVQHAFVSDLNTFRAQLGLGLLAQNVLLDKAASNHLQYVIANDKVNGGSVDMNSIDPVTKRSTFHIENPAMQFFTGVQEHDRAKFVGYKGIYVGEQITFGGGKGGHVAFHSLVSTIYHRVGLMMQGPRELGIAVGTDLSQTITYEVGYASPQRNASDFVGLYPADNQVGIPLHAGVEAPNPFPDLSTRNDDFPTKTGFPVSIIVDESANLEVVSFTITEAGTTLPLGARIMTAQNDPNRYLRNYVAFLVATSPLKPATSYNVVFSGRVNNVLLDRRWKFTTR